MMTNEEREKIMEGLSREQLDRYRRLMKDIRRDVKNVLRRRITFTELINSGIVDIPEELRRCVEAIFERDAMGPDVGEPAIDFRLWRDVDEYIRLSDFKHKRPVALIFGSYT